MVHIRTITIKCMVIGKQLHNIDDICSYMGGLVHYYGMLCIESRKKHYYVIFFTKLEEILLLLEK